MLKTIFLFLSIFFSSSAFLQAQEGVDKSKYIGLQYKGVLMGEKVADTVDMGGALVSGLVGDKEPMYGVNRMRKGTTQMLWLQKSTGKDAKGIPLWQVKDVLVFPGFGKNQNLHIGANPECTRNGKEEDNLMVLTELPPSSQTYKILKAWVANVKTEKFEETTLQGIRCQVYTD